MARAVDSLIQDSGMALKGLREEEETKMYNRIGLFNFQGVKRYDYLGLHLWECERGGMAHGFEY